MKALQDIVVLDLSRVLAGPYAGMLLADLGADVIKIEPPEVGDDSRAFGPYVGKESAYFMSLNRNKRSIVLNLKEPEARSIFMDLVARADIVLENYRPGTMEKLGLGYGELKKINPRIIYAACSGFGHSGPFSEKPAYDIIVQAMGGIMSITGPEGGPPCRVGASLGDITAALFTTIGIQTALYHRERTGEGQMVDVAMLDCQVAVLENAIARYFVSHEVPKPLGIRHPSITPFEGFPAKDGYIILGVGNDRLWEKFCALVERPDLAADDRFKTNPLRTRNHAELKAEMDPIFPGRTVDEWIDLLEEAGIPCGPLNSVDRVVAHPQVLARDMIVETDHPVAGKIKMAGVPIKMSLTPGSVDRPAPVLGQHTDEVLTSVLGIAPERIAELKDKKVIG